MRGFLFWKLIKHDIRGIENQAIEYSIVRSNACSYLPDSCAANSLLCKCSGKVAAKR